MVSDGIALNERLVDVFNGVVEGSVAGSGDGGVGLVGKGFEGGVVWQKGHLTALSHPLPILHTRPRVEGTGLRIKLLEGRCWGIDAEQNGRRILFGAPILR